MRRLSPRQRDELARIAEAMLTLKASWPSADDAVFTVGEIVATITASKHDGLTAARISTLARTRWPDLVVQLKLVGLRALRWELGHYDRGSRTMIPPALVLDVRKG